MKPHIICLITVHGIGFQQPPCPGIPGYADGLHAHLAERLGPALAPSPLYVVGSGTPGFNQHDPGLRILGTWTPAQVRTIDPQPDDQINDGRHRVVHIPLVYSHLEASGADVPSLMETAAMAALAFTHYTSVRSAILTLVRDVRKGLPHRSDPEGAPAPGLRVRTDRGIKPTRSVRRHHDPTGAWAVLRQLEDDLAAYVCHNSQRERVRGFVREVLVRLACRDDVAGIVVNAHSNGTVVAFDVLRQLPDYVVPKMQAFVTAGSPLRKYTGLFWWGREIGSLHQMARWVNYWDRNDPVADPLTPGERWNIGDEVPSLDHSELYRYTDPDTGRSSPAAIQDQEVDNLTHGRGGGLKAHNYWDNESQFVAPLAALLTHLVATVSNGA